MGGVHEKPALISADFPYGLSLEKLVLKNEKKKFVETKLLP